MKSNENLNEAGDFFQEFSREISIFALQYYLHEVVTPGVPNFQTLTQRVHFWACVCTNKLVATKAYLYNEEYNVDPIFLDDLWKLLRKTINSLKKLLSYPPKLNNNLTTGKKTTLTVFFWIVSKLKSTVISMMYFF